MSSGLSVHQVNFFQAFGYLVMPQYLTPVETAMLQQELDHAIAPLRESPGWKSGQRRMGRTLMDECTPLWSALADDDRFAGTADQLLRRKTIGIHVGGVLYCGSTAWHSDNLQRRYRGLKFLLYMDRLSGSNGALRVLPASHHVEMHRVAHLTHQTRKVFGLASDELPAQVLATSPGDAVVFDLALWHASCHGRRFRRAAELVYYADPRGKIESAALVEQMHRNHAATEGVPLYPLAWREAEDPRHSRWVRRLRELGVLDLQT